jgi:TfoX/Sxy family transcriptional regulator of competence genes
VAGKWARPPEKLVEAFDRALAGFPDAERRQMFGCPCVSLKGNMVSALHEKSWIIRLDPAERRALLAFGGGEFAPMGRVMREYATLPPGVVEDPPQVHEYGGVADLRNLLFSTWRLG